MSVEYKTNIRAISRALEGALNDGLKETADDILDLAQQLCPVKSGDLKASGHTVPLGNVWQVIFDADHAAFVEFGTQNQAAQPFLSPAVESVDPTFRTVSRIRAIIQDNQV